MTIPSLVGAACNLSPSQRNCVAVLRRHFLKPTPETLRVAALTAASAARTNRSTTAITESGREFSQTISAVPDARAKAAANVDVALGYFYKAVARIRTVALHPLDAHSGDNRVNALQHCYWAALLGASMDDLTAWHILEDHEQGSNTYSSRQDRANNRVGLAIGIKFRDRFIVWGGTLWDECVKAADDNELFYRPGNTIRADDIRGDASPTRVPVPRAVTPDDPDDPDLDRPDRPDRPDPIPDEPDDPIPDEPPDTPPDDPIPDDPPDDPPDDYPDDPVPDDPPDNPPDPDLPVS